MKECWAVEYLSFRTVFKAYNKFAKKMRQENRRHDRLARRTPVPAMADWIPKASLQFTDKQEAMCKISPVVMVLIHYMSMIHTYFYINFLYYILLYRTSSGRHSIICFFVHLKARGYYGQIRKSSPYVLITPAS